MASYCKEVQEFARRVRGRAGRGRGVVAARGGGDLRALMQCRRVIDHGARKQLQPPAPRAPAPPRGALRRPTRLAAHFCRFYDNSFV